MLVEIQSVSVEKEQVVLCCIALEKIMMAEDLYKDIGEEPIVNMVFDRKNEGHMKYLMRVVTSNRASKSARSFGEKIEKLAGSITNLSNAFEQKAA